MAGSYAYPQLTPEECVSFFKEVSQTSISEEDFKKPDVRRWHAYYSIIFELMTGRQADLMSQTQLQTASEAENPELHDESFSLLTFTMAMRRVLALAAITDFTVRDILDPKPKRLLRTVSAAINFIRFRLYREEVFNTKKDELDRQRESFEYVLKENSDLKKTLHAKKETHAARMQRMHQLKEENDTISLRIQEQHKHREVLQRGLAEMKNEISQRNATNDQVKVNILMAQAEGEKLSLRIVQSPERVKAEQDRAKNRIMALKSTQDEKQRRLGELQRQKDGLVTQQQNVDKAVRHMRDISNDSDRLEGLEKEICRQQDQQQDMRSSLLSATAKQDNLRQVQSSRRDKLSKLDLQYHAKKNALQEQISQLAHWKENLNGPRSSSESKKSELLAEKERVQADVQTAEEDLEAEIEKANNLYFEMLQQVDKTNMEVANGFGEMFNRQ